MTRRDKNGGVAKGPSRLAVEAILMTATKPLTTREIAEIACLPVKATATHVAKCLNKRLIHNSRPRNCPPGAYVWGQPEPEAKPDNVVPSRTTPVSGTYTGEPRSYTRPGGMVAYAIPSLGETERRRPILIGSSCG